MNLFINYDIGTINECSIDTEIAVFDRFFSRDCKILYVINDSGNLMGVITVKNFLECLRDGRKDYINTNCSVLHEKEYKGLLQEARGLVEQRNITTAIPVLDENDQILYEVCCDFRGDRDKDILKKYHDKFARYSHSYYLKNDVEIICKMLSEQKILVLGSEEIFEGIFGVLFSDKKNLTFITENITEGYRFLSDREDLFIDLTAAEHSGRDEIYTICNNGYGWKHFWDEIFACLEQGHISMMDRVLKQGTDIFKGYLEKYVEGTIYMQTNSLLASWLMEYLLQTFRETESKTGLFRSEMLKCRLIMNGEKSEFVFANISDFCLLADRIIQWSGLCRYWNKKIKILNLVCDTKLEFTETEKERFRRICETGKCLECSEDWKEKNSFFDLSQKQTDPCNYLFYGRGVWQRRCFENDINMFNDYYKGTDSVENGIRHTCEQPEYYIGTIYMIGACIMFGSFVEDQYTIPSLIQKKINTMGKRYRVVNLGSTISMNYERLMKKLRLCPEDIVLILYPMITEAVKKQISVIDIGDSVNLLRKEKYPRQDVFLDVPVHFSDYGSEIYAESIWRELKKHLTDRHGVYKNNIYNLFRTDYTDLDVLYGFKQYFSELQDLRSRISEKAKRIGCIVMNCNPFTRGHRYLIEKALEQVDYIIVFVVEEDRSFFSFYDRLEMVKRGTGDLENIAVVRSGEFVLSNMTFSEYFCKDSGECQQKEVSAIYDLAIFARYVAPELNISYRFVGEEPFDHITDQYNRDMKKVLSSFDIGVVELPRKKLESGEVISATKVRKALSSGYYEQIREMLPESTLDYLKLKTERL